MIILNKFKHPIEVSERYIISNELDTLFSNEHINIANESKTHVLNLFFKAIEDKMKDITYEILMNEYKTLITIPFITSISYAKASEISVEKMVDKTIQNIQARIKESIISKQGRQIPLQNM